MTALSVTDLCLSRGGAAVLNGVTLTVTAGSALILRGPNGIGKTTLLRAIAGLQPHDAGQITGAVERTVYAAHLDGVKSALTVTENLDFWAACFGTRNTAAAMDAMNLTALANRRAGHLSAGQKRRLGLARLPVSNRPIWLLDEPTVSLDTGSVQIFTALLRAHLDAGGMAVIATHIDLGLDAPVLDLSQYRAKPGQGAFSNGFDGAFGGGLV